MDAATLLICVILGLLVLLSLAALFTPIRLGLKLLLHMVCGLFGLVIASVFGSLCGLTIGINPVNLLIVTVFGPAGALLLLALGFVL